MNRWSVTVLCVAFLPAAWGGLPRAAEPRASAVPPAPPWPAQYKLRADETARLTPADIVGPDGLVYPNWTRVGIRGGIPAVPVRVRLRDFGVVPDEDRDAAAAILAAAEKLAAGPGAIQFEPGTYYLDRPLAIRRDGIVLRGAGRDRTRIVFRYGLGEKGIRWVEPWESGELFADSTVTLHALPDGLRQLEIYAGDQRVANREHHAHWGNTFQISAGGSEILKRVPAPAETAVLRGVARYQDGRTRELTKTFRLIRRSGDPGARRRVAPDVAIGFGGQARPGSAQNVRLAKDGRRGDTRLTLETTAGLQAGDRLVIEGPATQRWKDLTRNACPHGMYRRNMLEIAAIAGAEVTVTDPLRIEFPVSDGSFVYKIDPIQQCGIEDLTIEQTENLWITTVLFSYAWECWARGVTVKKCGRYPIYGASAKRCVIEDCVFDDAWFKGGGGTAYAGWEFSYDCLMSDCTTYRLRHAPCVQWSASGNVIRRSRFVDSDMQWHSGWTNENLFEQCTVVSRPGNGGYGHGAWASPPEDVAHGPNGPRNVVYNCDIQGTRAGIWMGGMNEGWMILYNRIAAGNGPAVFAKTCSFDHVIRGNVFRLAQANQPAVQLATPDCSGVELVDNRVSGGNGRLVAGAGQPLVDRDNLVLPAGAEVPRPRVPTPSIFAWQAERGR